MRIYAYRRSRTRPFAGLGPVRRIVSYPRGRTVSCRPSGRACPPSAASVIARAAARVFPPPRESRTSLPPPSPRLASCFLRPSHISTLNAPGRVRAVARAHSFPACICIPGDKSHSATTTRGFAKVPLPRCTQLSSDLEARAFPAHMRGGTFLYAHPAHAQCEIRISHIGSGIK